MAYDGYWRLGDTEIINAARTAAYVGNLMPTFGLKDCTDCDDLAAALGDDEYRTPGLDLAPWVDSSNPILNDFWGVYPLGVSGVDDGTREVASTELIGDGAVMSRPRAASREMRFDVVLLGRNERAVTEGLHWLNRALDAYRCDGQSLDCTGTPLSFFSACPPACDYSACPDEIVGWDWVAERVNWVSNPSPSASSTGGTYAATNGATVTIPQYGTVRSEWAATVAFAQTGIVYTETAPFQDIVGGPEGATKPAGTPVSAYIDYIEVSRPELRVQVFIQLRTGTSVVQTIPAVNLQGQSAYFGTSVQGVSTVSFDNFRVFLVIANSITPIVVGDYLTGSRFMFETAPSGGNFFYGWSNDFNDEHAYVWYGDQESSASVQYAAPDEASHWSVSPPPLQPGSDKVNWAQQWDGCPAPYGAGLRLSAPNTGQPIIATRTMDGLIPGSWYRVEIIAVPGNGAGFEARVRGTTASLSIPYSFTSQCGNSEAPSSLWFLATSPVMFLDLVMQPNPNDSRDQDFLVRRLSISRATSDFNIYSTQFPNDGSVLNGWSTGVAPANFRFDIERDRAFINGVGSTFLSLGPTAAPPQTIPAGQVLISRSIRGLTPGKEYKVTFVGQFTGTFASPPVGRFGLAVSNGGQTNVDVDTDFSWGTTIVHTFVASAEAQTVSLVVVNPYIVTGTGSGLEVGLFSMAVERLEGTDGIPYPDSTEEFQRTLYQVTAMSGPTVMEQYDMDCGAMMRVSFGLRAGVPHQFGPLKNAGSALGGSSSPLQQIDCLYGEAVRQNLAINPSFEVAPGMWVGSFGPTRQPGDAFSGSWRGEHAAMSSASAFSADSTPVDIPVTPGNTYTFSGYFKANVTRPTRAILWVQYLDALDSEVGTSVYSPYVTLTPEYQRLEVASLAPAGATQVRLHYGVNVIQNVNFGAGDTVDVDAFQFEVGGVATPYFDGSYPNASWAGTANQSVSTYTPSEVSDLVDPDCPPLPAPPGPPTIEEDCIEDPTAWTRYTIDIPASAIPRFSSVLPVVTIRTGSSTARQVRMRWYPNPDGLNITQLPACAYDGEVIVSYVPPQAEMVIDTITREATATVNGGPEQQATQLLYGPDGGPMVWPELRCNQAYIFTVDVDATDSVDELDILLALGLKV